MIPVKPTNNAKTLEVRKKKWGRIVELTAVFSPNLKTKATIPAKALRMALKQKPGDFQDFETDLVRVHQLDTNETRLFFVPNDHNDLVVVKTADLLAAVG